jgi:hypothetical protein
MSDSGDEDEILDAVLRDSTATYEQIRVKMESGEFVVTGFYLESETVHKAQGLSLGGIEIHGLSGELELNNPDGKYLWLLSGDPGELGIHTEEPESS